VAAVNNGEESRFIIVDRITDPFWVLLFPYGYLAERNMSISAARNLAVVPTPMTASGAVAAGELEKYVRWLRGREIAGVVIWTATGGGQSLDVTEREELYAVWRAGLLPQQQVWTYLPAGAVTVGEEELSFEASHARELGADGLVCAAWHLDVLRRLVGDLPVLVDVGSDRGFVNESASAGAGRLSFAVAVGASSEREEVLARMEDDARAVALLDALAEQGVSGSTGAFSPGGNRAVE
jgi:hypothetical protein